MTPTHPRASLGAHEADYRHRVAGAALLRPGAGRVCHRRHGIHARVDLLARPLPDPAGRVRRHGTDRSPRTGPRPSALLRPDEQAGRPQGLPRGAAGHRDHGPSGGHRSAPGVRHPDRRHGLRLRRSGRLRGHRPQAGQGPDRQVVALHRLVAPAADRQAACLCAGRCHPPARRLRAAEAAARQHRPRALAARGNGHPDQPGHLSHRTRRCLAPHQGPPQVEEAAWRAGRCFGMARA